MNGQIKMLLWLLIAVGLAMGAYIRLAPSDPVRWHVAPEDTERDLKGGVVRVVETGPDGLARLDKIARATPRTSVLAGSLEEGMITYITRTKVFGFPDYTTVQLDGDTLRIYARLRFGRKDFGVNRDRVTQWLALLQP
ncbi:DUF1499 domain-containing protein [Ruegeria sp. SCSIO 43209]|uniref:DUF1499 domain-containing protein n=1 Tax=Ruegeria sp. SCSIO 43209 TaxID=2793010 RepID=UPI001481421C|nr:DUF1499 domain-containing protein [Ruegeria sp. SCSIO 43209]UAB90168.1 DUF1499 domain-containing protein [Ruegeria sp. SCSIO 43209]